MVLVVGCSSRTEDQSSATPSTLPALEIATETLPPTTAPTATPVPPTATPTSEPLSPTPTAMPALPTSTPYPATMYLNDQWQQIDVPPILEDGLDTNWLAFANYNDRTRTTPPNQTPEPPSVNQSLYLIRPDTRQRVKVADIPVSAGDRVFWSPTGLHVLYFAERDVDEAGNPIGGLYMLDFKVGLKYRLFDMDNLNPRSIPGHVPVWSADGSKVAFVLPTEYATDIFIMDADGTNFRNVTQHGSYDLWASFSPDGKWLAFVSDRLTCPTWTPNEPNTCDHPGALPPTQGNLFLSNLETGEVRQVTDVLLNGAPRWITPTKLAFSTGGGSALAENSDLWLVDIEAGSAVQINPPNSFSVSEQWSTDAGRVIYQRIGESTDIVIADSLGREIAANSEYTFPRYGMAAAWSLDGQYIAIGGRNGQCPYGIIVVDPAFQVVTAPSRSLLACDPLYAPGGRYLAFTGITPSPRTDGRLDIYIANINGLGASNVTSDLKGQMRLLGWVGGTS